MYGLWKQGFKNAFKSTKISKEDLPDEFTITVYHNRNKGDGDGRVPSYVFDIRDVNAVDEKAEIAKLRGRPKKKMNLTIDEIVELYDKGMSYTMIASRAGSNVDRIGDIIRDLIKQGKVMKRYQYPAEYVASILKL